MNMNMGLSTTAAAGILGLLLLLGSSSMQADVYKVVDAEGNVTYTDQAPADGSSPMKLPELSIIETDYAPEPTAPDDAASADGEAAATQPTPRDLRKMYKDFRITSPAEEETFWGTENTVVVSWASSTAILPDMSVRLFIDGQQQGNTQDGMLAATLDRGEHKVYAELLDSRGRRVVTTPTVTFFVQQNSVGFNQPQATQHRGN